MSQRDRLLIALDIDGTILFEDGSFSPGVERAVSEAVERGHVVTLATGRSWEKTVDVLDALGLEPEYVVCSNGATIMDRNPLEPSGYSRHTIETFDATEVLQFIKGHLPEANYMVELGDGARLFTHPLTDWDIERPNARQVTFDEMLGQQATRVVVVSPEHGADEFNDVVEQMGLSHVTYAVGWSAWLDIAPHGINKSTALEKVRSWLHVDPDDVVVMGDGRNDIEMMQWARDGGGEAVVMGQAPEEVASSGTRITLTVDGGGVAAALAALGAAAPVG